MSKSSLLKALTFVFGLFAAFAAQAELKPEKVHVADIRKNQVYLKDGLITGGDQAIDDFVIKDIRRATNAGYERMVVDLEGTRNGEPVAIERPPYYQVSVTPDEKRLVLTFFGKPKLGFESGRILNAFKKSAVVENVVLLPTLEENNWTFAVELKAGRPVEVFELANPVRVIIDIKTN